VSRQLVNDPAAFADEALAGFAAAHPEHVRLVPGGVVRAEPLPRGRVALVVGGGTGHHPAFAGWVGEGLAAGAACGGVFASPAASQIRSVALEAEAGGGVLLAYGNYAGDVLHFGLAAERLRSEGVDVRELAVTDDVASAPVGEETRRRGTAGDVVVLKVAGAAAAAGLDLDGVERVARAANAATRTFGVALRGCTLPGAPEPLFSLPPGRMGLGMGIHGEPGVGEVDLTSADGVADVLLDGLLAELEPAPGQRVAVLVNGLGSTTAEELFVVHRRVAERLAGLGLVAVRPEVGQLVSSLDMAGVSLTLSVLDDELERYWSAPCDTPELRRGAAARPTGPLAVPRAREVPPDPVPPAADEASRAGAARLAAALDVVRDTVLEHADHLGRVDAVAGDGDHGIGMSRGSTAAARAGREALEAGAGAGTLLVRAGDAWAERGGGTSGALWGVALTAVGRVLGDAGHPGDDDVVRGVRAGLDAVTRLGGARPGDKTLVDAADPFVRALEEATAAGTPLAPAWRAAAERATAAAEATAQTTARRGRARTHGDRSLGTPDAGALSFALVVTALGGHL